MADTINGIDLAAANLGAFVHVGPDGYMDAPGLERALQTIIDRPGALSSSRRFATRPFGLPLWVKGSSASDVKDKLERLRGIILRSQPNVLTFGAVSGRELRAEYTGPISAAPAATADGSTAWRVVVPYLLADPPCWIASSDTTVGSISTSNTDLPQGSLPPYGLIIKVIGTTPGTALTITLKDSAGVTLAALGLTLATSLGASDYVVVDVDNGTIFRNTSGLPNDGTNIYAAGQWTSGDFPELRDPSYWNHYTSAWPKITVSAGTGTAVYRKCWA